MIYPDAINWFEIPSEDFDRAVKFYSTLYGAELKITQMNTGGELPMPMAGPQAGNQGPPTVSEWWRRSAGDVGSGRDRHLP